jgi:RNA polymerase sigma-70 factor (ECF subfamily)
MSSVSGLSEDEWRGLYQRLEKPLYNLACRYVHRSQQAEDIVHDAFLQLWARRAGLQAATADRYAWIAVVNLCRKRRRWSRAKQFLSGESVLESLVEKGAIDIELARTQEQLALHAAIERLPEKLRSVLLLTEFSEMCYEAVAEMLSIPPGTVASRRNQALKQLRLKMKQE